MTNEQQAHTPEIAELCTCGHVRADHWGGMAIGLAWCAPYVGSCQDKCRRFEPTGKYDFASFFLVGEVDENIPSQVKDYLVTAANAMAGIPDPQAYRQAVDALVRNADWLVTALTRDYRMTHGGYCDIGLSNECTCGLLDAKQARDTVRDAIAALRAATQEG